MSKKKYKNISNSPQNLIGIGVVEPGKIIVTEKVIANPNFELVKSKESDSKKSSK